MTERIHGGVEVLQQEEGGDDDEDQEEGVVVEDGEGGGLVVSDLILLPQDSEDKRENNMSIPFHNHGPTQSIFCLRKLAHKLNMVFCLITVEAI